MGITNLKEHLLRDYRQIPSAIFDFFFPDHLTCYFCEAELPPGHMDHICVACSQQIETLPERCCVKCGKPIELAYAQHADYFFKCKECQEQFAYYYKHRYFTYYEGGVKNALIGLKYKRQIYQARYFGVRLAAMIKADMDLSRFDLIVPVPVHFLRRFSRGYNQAEVLAHQISKQLRCPKPVEILARKRKTKKLKNLGRSSRKTMLENAIMVKRHAIPELKDKRILIVDDIFTTGATLNACAKALYEAGSAEVMSVTVARGR
ncbi:MAG: ComF family protein [Firmicutes bacterium]|nr:ComF family protein [Bacillota bacterium]